MNKFLLGLLLSGAVVFTAGYGQTPSPEVEKTPSAPAPVSAPVAPAAVKEEVKNPAPVPEKKNEPASEAVKDSSAAAAKQAVEKKEQSKAGVSSVNNAAADSLVLMDFSDGDFRSQRVAGFVPEKKNPDVAVNTVSPAPQSSFSKVSKERLVNLFVWGCVLLSIITIVALYRHNRKRKHRIFRRIR